MLLLVLVALCFAAGVGLRLPVGNTTTAVFQATYTIDDQPFASSTHDRKRQADVLLLYTTSGSQTHRDSLCLQAKLNSRPGTPRILSDADVMVYDNGVFLALDEEGSQVVAQATPSAQKDCLSQFPGDGRRELYMTSQNSGYTTGVLEAFDKLMHLGKFREYKWVVHLHPDIFIVDPRPLAKSLISSSKAVISGTFDPRIKKVEGDCLTVNFFAFRPSDVEVNAFSDWPNITGPPECFLSRRAFLNKDVDQVPHRSFKQYTDKSWDAYGMWHQHDVTWIEQFLKDYPQVTSLKPGIPLHWNNIRDSDGHKAWRVKSVADGDANPGWDGSILPR